MKKRRKEIKRIRERKTHCTHKRKKNIIMRLLKNKDRESHRITWKSGKIKIMRKKYKTKERNRRKKSKKYYANE